MRPFDPPLLNSANPWATTQEDLQTLYDCPYTGAVTTRTTTHKGFRHDDKIHQYCFFDGSHNVTRHSSSNISSKSSNLPDRSTASGTNISSLNTLGYSPLPLSDYIRMVLRIIKNGEHARKPMKPIIFSVTGSASEVAECYQQISKSQPSPESRFLMEINLSCPNIAGNPPPAYSAPQLSSYLLALSSAMQEPPASAPLEVGIKTPPYTHQAQFTDLISALLASPTTTRACPVSFITATNTLGNCLVLCPDDDNLSPPINSADGSGLGGMAGAALHPLALGNVRKIRQMLDAQKELGHVTIIGVGGVSDAAGYRRMRGVGAEAVAVGTAVGSEGVGVFEKIAKGS